MFENLWKGIEDPRIGQKYEILLGHLENQLKHYEDMKEKIKDENCKNQIHYINGLIEGLTIAIKSAK